MKKILVLSPVFPSPPDNGAKIRIYNIIKELSKNHKITLLSLSDKEVEYSHIDIMKEFCDKIYYERINKSKTFSLIKTLYNKKSYRINKFEKKGFKNKVNRFLGKINFNIIWCNFLNMSVYLDNINPEDYYIILDQHNADELAWKTYYKNSTNIFYKLFSKRNIKNIRIIRERNIHMFNLILSVSDRDKKFTEKVIDNSINVKVVPNGVDINYFKPKPGKEGKNKNIIFCGSMDVTMNIRAVKDFVEYVMPKVRREIPEAKLWIVGRNPVESIFNLENDFIKVTGSVDDVRPYYEKAAVSVAPFKFGGGTKLKIAESLAMKVPVVATSIGVQGIDVVDGEHLLINDEWDEFAGSVIEVLTNEKLAGKLSENGRKLVERKYSWKKIVEDFTFKTKIFE